MIFVTVGLEKFPFDRLVRAVDRAIDAGAVRGPVFGQIGHSRYEPRRFDFCRVLPFDDTRRRLQDADIVVSHAGVGTILLALSLGKNPIVFPRRREFGEQLDDHQVDLATRLETSGRVLVAGTEEALVESLAQAEMRRSAPPGGPGAPVELDALTRFLTSTLGGRDVR